MTGFVDDTRDPLGPASDGPSAAHAPGAHAPDDHTLGAHAAKTAVSDPSRLAALRRSGLLDTAPAPEFDRLTALARRVLGVPTALVTLVDRDRQVYKSAQGLAEPWASRGEVPLSHSFCKHVVESGASFVVGDARVHPLVADNAATRELGVVAYVGVPVRSPDGHVLGSLCAVDDAPRQWTADDVGALRDLGDLAEQEIALRAAAAANGTSGHGSAGRDMAALDATEHDAAERDRIERDLRESEERYQTFLELSAEGIWRFDIDTPIPTDLPAAEQVARILDGGYLAECNASMARMYGFERAADLVGRALSAFLDPAAPETAAYLTAFVESGYRLDDVESSEADREGVVHTFENTLTGQIEAGPDGKPALVRAWGTQRDVSARRAAEAALRQSEERLRLVSHATNDAIWDWDMRTGRFAATPAFGELFGWREQAAQGFDNDWMVQRMHPDDRERAFAAFRAILASGGSSWESEHRYERADGTWADVLERGYIVREDGVPVRTVGSMQDLTARKETERALVEANEAAVAARQAAEAVARAKSSLLMNMSHEIRTPLTAILGYADLLADEAPADLMDLVEPIGRGGRRLMDTLNSVLDLAQIEAGTVCLVPDRVDLLAETREACAALLPIAQAKGLDLRTVGAPTAALADHAALGRVLTNLVGNAVKFTAVGSVTVETGRDGRWGWVRVSDTGVGIGAEFLPDLFSEFKQESEGHARSHEGNGLGLAITKRLVELMNGEIAVESEKGAGSVFTVRVPLAPEGAYAEVA